MPSSQPTPPAPGAEDDHVISRAFLEAGGVDALVARDAPLQTLLTEEERQASLLATLAIRPPGPAWVFAYGSLIWNPTVQVQERRLARVEGWHRSFCLSVRAGRGTADHPGLVLGLDAGGSCAGLAYRVDEATLPSELALLWRREMVSGAYVPRWLEVLDPRGQAFGHALAFTMNTDCDQYAGQLPEEEVVHRLATACGALGSAADYLYRTCEGLRGCGLTDTALETLATQVRARQQNVNCAAS